MATNVANFVKGIRGSRVKGVTQKQILAFFHGTPEAFVKQGIDTALDAGSIIIERGGLQTRGKHAYYYTFVQNA